ncbi:uncharacterized protein LOC5513244 [Nematostella vectensis]|uniref:uncharacterized protein LOC5513244 n=1 Tax=Nematostella vectensis TaxID=45351 RepID=UPI00207757B4|nr:uncharacterized protein LOC5513244 [Nematostella vectensis]XP_048581433.1 uncharacterized protein LOC5513244 [Nematostella vectensis]
MEKFKVLGKLKKKELAFGVNNVKGLNDREERLLKGTIGLIERQKKKTLFKIQTEVKVIQCDLKETNAVLNLSDHTTFRDNDHYISPKTRITDTPSVWSSQGELGMCEIKEERNRGPAAKKLNCWLDSSSQKARDNECTLEQNPTPTSCSPQGSRSPQFFRPRNISTGSMPGSPPRNSGHILRKQASHPELFREISSPSQTRRDVFVMSSDNECYLEQHPTPKSCSPQENRSPQFFRTRNISTGSMPGSPRNSGHILRKQASHPELFREISSPSQTSRQGLEQLTNTPRLLRRQRDSSEGRLVNSNESSPMVPRKIPLSRVRSHPIINAEISSPSTCRKNVRFSQSPLLRKISCPILDEKPSKDRNYVTLGSYTGSRTLSRMTIELPDVNEPCGSQGHADKVPLRVSPSNSSWCLSDKALQDKVNHFLDSIQIADDIET